MALKTILYQGEEFEISYEILNPTCTQNLIILHGWGSSKALMNQAFSQSFKEFCHIYIDLPGFGNSKSPPFPLQTQDYAEIVKLILSQLDKKIDCVMGHSFGGKVGVLLNPSTLILLSSAGIPKEKSLKIHFKIALSKTLNRICPPLSLALKKILRSKDVENMNEIMYQTFKNVVDEDFSNYFAHYNNLALIFWGRQDTITPLKSGEKIATLIKKSHFYVLEGEHFFFLDKGKVIEELYRSL